jgi:large subunit ribosomal protein L32
MAVPKKKISKSKRGLRRGGNKTNKDKLVNVVINKTTGEYQLPHHVDSTGTYKGKKVIKTKKDKPSKESEE